MECKHVISPSLNISFFRVNLADNRHPEWSKLAKAFLLKAQGKGSPTPQLLESGSHNLQAKKQNQNTLSPKQHTQDNQQYGTKSVKWGETEITGRDDTKEEELQRDF